MNWDRTLAALEADLVLGDQGGTRAARAIRRAVVRGEDATRSVARLVRAMAGASTLAIIEPLAVAIVFTLGRAGAWERLAKLIRRVSVRSWLCDALVELDGAGVDPSPIVPYLAELRPCRELDVLGPLSALVEREPTRLAPYLRALASSHPGWAATLLGRQRAASLVSLVPARDTLEELARAKDPALREEAQRAIRQLAEVAA